MISFLLKRLPFHTASDLGLVPRRFRQRLLIVTGLRHLPGFLQQRANPGLVVGLLERQDRQTVEGQTDQRGQLMVLRVG